MFKHILLPLALIVAFATACTSVPTGDIKIRAEAAPKANFGGYKTYAWLGAATIVNDPAGMWKPKGFDADAEIKHLIDTRLRARGMSENNTDPDLVVAFAIGIDMAALKLKMNPETKLDVLSNVPQSGLLVVMIDASTGFVIWAAEAHGEVHKNMDDETVKGRLDYVVTRMIQKMPK